MAPATIEIPSKRLTRFLRRWFSAGILIKYSVKISNQSRHHIIKYMKFKYVFKICHDKL